MEINLKNIFYFTFLLAITSPLVHAQEIDDSPPDLTPVSSISESAVQEIRSKQFTLSFTKFINKECRISIFSNKTFTRFIIKKFKNDEGTSFNEYLENQDSNINNEKNIYKFDELLQGATKKHSFLLEDRNLIISYVLENKKTNSYTKEKSILEKDISCN
jgi:hypothetical protein